jgi:hypothetical protein
MILADLVLPSRVNQRWWRQGIDDPDWCMAPIHWHRYDHEIQYVYNSRGFRDEEWPADLVNATWCIGDSFTVGIGVPLQRTWPQLLQQKLQRRSINVSMDGASNDWMARRACQIIKEVQPSLIIIHWTYTHRREIPNDQALLDQRWRAFYQDVRDRSWPDCDTFNDVESLPDHIQQEIQTDPYWPMLSTPDDHDRRLDQPEKAAVLDDTLNDAVFFDAVDQVEQCRGSTLVLHTFIPSFTANSDRMRHKLNQHMQGRLWIPEVEQLDWARDGHHYDVKTAQVLVNNICEVLPEHLINTG